MPLRQREVERAGGSRPDPNTLSVPARVEEEVRPRGAMVVTLLYLLVIVAAWVSVYLSLLGHR